MSARATIRATPTLLRVGLAEAVAYRAEMLVWVLATTMPLVMMALWTSVAQGSPIGRYGQRQFVTYFLVTFIVRQLTGSWASWQMNFEVRNGTLAMRLLRPIHPLWAYAAETVASMPMRAIVSLPAAVVTLGVVGRENLSSDPVLWLASGLAIAGAWLLTLLVNFVIGCASFFIESSTKLMDAWLVLFFVFSGYLIPFDLFPHRLAAVAAWLPFRYQLGLPVELLTGGHDRGDAFALLARQWIWVVGAMGATRFSWNRGVKRFAAHGG